MRSRHWLTYALLVALVAASATHPWLNNALQDLNGDANVDVLDMQLLVTDVLNRDAQNSDLNGDGRVDVLDLQLFLASDGAADTRNDPAPAEQSPALVPAPTFAPQPHSATWLFSLMPTPEIREALSYSPNTAPRTLANTGANRYLFRLTSHAPPVKGSMKQM